MQSGFKSDRSYKFERGVAGVERQRATIGHNLGLLNSFLGEYSAKVAVHGSSESRAEAQ